MTAQEVARHLNARRTGWGKWLALCPHHNERNPSLSIAEGKTGVLLRCWSQNCAVEDIVRAAGLTMSSLFYASQSRLDPKGRAEALRTHRKAENASNATRRQLRYWLDETRKWESVAALLFAHLLRGTMHDAAKVAALWYKSIATARSRLERLREYDRRYPHDVEVFPLVRIPKGITAQFVGPEIAEVIGL